MSTLLGELYYKLSADSKELIAAINNSETSVKDLEKSIQAVAKSSKEVGDKLSKNLTVPIVALGTAAVVMAADAEVAMKKFAKAFEGSTDEAAAGVELLNKSFGVAESSAISAMAFTGDLLKGFGATGEQALATSLEVQKLAAALSASDGIAFEEASMRVTKALTGETDGLKDLGFVIRQTDIDQQLMLRGQQDLTGSAQTMAKAQAILEIATTQAGDAIENFGNNSDTLSYQFNTLIGDAKQMGIEFGTVMIPLLKDIISEVRPVIQGFGDLDNETKKTILVFAGIAAAAGPAITAISGIASALAFLAANPVVAAIAAAAALTAGVVALGKSLESKAIAKASERFGAIADEIGVSGKEILAVEKSLKGWTEVNVAGVKAWAEKLGITEKQFLQIAIASDKVSDSYKESAKQILAQMSGVKILTAAEEMRAERAAYAAYQQEQAIKAIAEAEAAAAAARAAIDKKYTDARAKVVDILKGEQSEQDKLLAQIRELQSTPWATGALETDRQKAVAILRKKIEELAVEEAQAAKEKLAAIQKEQVAERKAAAEALDDQQEHYAYVASAIKKKIANLEAEKKKAVALAQAQGQETATIEAQYAAQLTALNDQLKANELARQAEIKAKHDAYWAQLLAENQAALVALEAKKQAEITAAAGSAEQIASINLIYSAQEEQIRLNMQANELARVAELTTINQTYYDQLGSMTSNRLEQLELAKQAEIAAAQEAGLAIDAILQEYALKEQEIRAQQAAEQQEEKDNFERMLYERQATTLQLLEERYQAELEKARLLGVDTTAIEKYYADEREKIRKEEEDDKLKKTKENMQEMVTVMNQAFAIIDTTVNTTGENWNDTLTVLADTFLQAAMSSGNAYVMAAAVAVKAISSIINAVIEIANAEEARKKLVEDVERQIQEVKMQNLKKQIEADYKAQIDSINKIEAEKLDAYLATLSEREIAALKASGVLEETELERIEREMAAAQAAGDAELAAQLEREKKIAEIRAEAETARLAAEKKYKNAMAQWEYDKAVQDKAAKLLEIKAQKAAALAGLAWWQWLANWDRDVKRVYDNLYNEVNSFVIPQPVFMAKGGYVPQMPAGIPAVLGEGKYDEVVLPLSDKVFKKLGDKIVESIMGTTRQQSTATQQLNQTIQVVMDGKVMYEVVNNGLTNRSIRVPSAAIVS